MTDRYKGFIVHLDKEIRNDDAEIILIALRTIKHVSNVKPLIASADDSIAYLRGRQEIITKMYDLLTAEFTK